MIKGTILIVGEAFDSFTETLHANGYDHITLRDSNAANLATKNPPPFVLCDFGSEDQVLAAVDTIGQPVTALVSLYENYVLPTAWISRHLGLPGMSVEAALACTDKLAMRRAFAGSPEPISPDFAAIDSEADVVAFAKSHSFPLILKPANLVKSLLVSRSDDLDELLANYRQTTSQIDAAYRRYAPNRQPSIIIEEFLAGPMYSVAAFADNQGLAHIIDGIVDLQTARDAGYRDNFLYSRSLPSRLNVSQQAAIRHCAKVGIAALGMKSSPAHVEIMLTSQGPRIIEIGARNGGYRERMYRLASGINIIQATVDTAIGVTPLLKATRREFCSVVELFPRRHGSFEKIIASDKIARLPTCSYFDIKAEPGQLVGRAADGYKCCAVVMLNGDDQQAIERDLSFIQSNAEVVTD